MSARLGPAALLTSLFFTACDDPKLAAVPAKGGEFASAMNKRFAERWSTCTGLPLTAVETLLRIDDEKKRTDNSIAKKRLAYDRAKGKGCLDALVDAPCEDLLNVFVEGKGACDAPFVGQVGLDDTCFEGNECAAGSFCEPTGECEGACRKFTKLGGPCGAGTVCEPDTQCIGGLCRERAGDGDACAGENRVGCKSGLFCLQTSATTGVCSKGIVDGTCSRSNVCLVGHHCAPKSKTATEGTCIASRAEGEACEPGLSQCASFTSCMKGEDGSFACRAWGGEGSPCGRIDEESVDCFNAWCGADQAQAAAHGGTCRAVLDNGAPCEDSTMCASGICDPFGQLCVSACPLQ
ncbi:MAG: hypothetical protein IT381_11210 [Deltaproteobacteria bacterium]|nr:hypothetical protein [Deltaproteobacteria bacterium]